MKQKIKYLLEGQYKLLQIKKDIVLNVAAMEELQQKFNNTMEILIEEMEEWDEVRDGKLWDATIEQITIDFMGMLNRIAYSYRTAEEKKEDMKISMLNSIFKAIRWSNHEEAKEEVEQFNKKFNSNLNYYKGMGVEELDEQFEKWDTAASKNCEM